MGASTLSILGLTVLTSLAATALVLPPGLLLAYAFTRWRGPLRVFVETVASLPLVLPPTAVGLLLLSVFSRRSPLGAALERFDILFTWKAVVLASAVMAFPLFLRSVRTSFEEVDPRLVAVARTLGLTPLATFRRVLVPLSYRGILSGLLLAFSRALGEFGATMLVAGNIPGRTQTLSLAMFQRYQLGQDDDAFTLVLVTCVLAFGCVGVTELVRQRRHRRLAS